MISKLSPLREIHCSCWKFQIHVRFRLTGFHSTHLPAFTASMSWTHGVVCVMAQNGATALDYVSNALTTIAETPLRSNIECKQKKKRTNYYLSTRIYGEISILSSACQTFIYFARLKICAPELHTSIAASHMWFSGQSMCVICRVPRCFLLFGRSGAHLPRFHLSRGFPFSVRSKQRFFFFFPLTLHVPQIVQLYISFFFLFFPAVRCAMY